MRPWPRSGARRYERRTSSSWDTPRAARRRCMRCCGHTRRSTCRTPRSRGSSRPTCSRASSRGAPVAGRRRSRSIWRCSRRPLPSSAPARRHRRICGRARRRRASRRSRPRRGSSRSCASPRASCARCTCSCCRVTWRSRRIFARRSPSKRSVATAAGYHASPTARSCCSTREPVRYVEQLRRYEQCFPPSGSWCSSTTTSEPTTTPRCARSCASWRWTTHDRWRCST